MADKVQLAKDIYDASNSNSPESVEKLRTLLVTAGQEEIDWHNPAVVSLPEILLNNSALVY